MRQGNVMAWFFLAGAVLPEVTATLSIKAALGQPALYAVVVLGYTGAFMCLTLVLRRGMPLGVTYGIWAAAGVLLVELEASH
ncbi:MULTISPECIES: SMR family transporter [Kocuria]|uniref:DMT family transporter n=1 Tax=Kocuria TaxID=57493 RepID=UPI0026B28528|nr:SMR family transporter [Kocuria sp. PD6]